MTKTFSLSFLLGILKITCIVLFFTTITGCDESQSPESDTSSLHSLHQETTVTVRTEILHKGIMHKTLQTYGRVVPLPGHVQLINVPYEAIVQKILVVEGQSVLAGAPLVEMVPSPSTELQLEQARIETESAKKKVQLVKQRIRLKLVTQLELLDAQYNLDILHKKLKMLLDKGIDGETILKSDSEGIVWKIHVQPGEIIPAGTIMLAVVPHGQEGVIVGVEPEDIPYIRIGQNVNIKQVNTNTDSVIAGKISLITQQINPDTRLLDILVKPDLDRNHLLLNDYVSAEIILTSKETLIAPRNAVQPENNGYCLFTVENDHAVHHTVNIGLETQKTVEIISGDLHAGMHIVVLGNYELNDNMTVREEASR